MSWYPRKKVVVPVDFSDQSIAAVDTALDAVDDASHVHVVHVLPELSPVEPGVVWGQITEESRLRHATQAVRERLSGAKYEGVQIAVSIGDAGHEIIDHARREQADLIVMPSHGRTGFKRLLIGSVAERVLRLAHCPVLVLRNGANDRDN